MSLYPSVTPSPIERQHGSESSSSPALPEGWEECQDDASGMSYYVSIESGETVFEPPTAPASGTPSGTLPTQRAPPPPLTPRPWAAVSTSVHPSGPQMASNALIAVHDVVFGSSRPSPTVAATAAPQPRQPIATTVQQTASGSWQVVLAPMIAGRTRPTSTLGPFSSEVAARAAARQDAPPKWENADQCVRCAAGFGLLRRRTHCRNCGYSHCRQCCTMWPAASMPATFTDGEANCRVCLSCDASASALRTALLSGDAEAVCSAHADGVSNCNLRCHLPPGEGQQAQMLPVHLAAAADSLATLRWLAEEHHCALVGERALTLGKGSTSGKSVLRIAIEAQATDVLQWLVAADDAAAHLGLPLPMPLNTGCHPAAVHRALEAALKDGYRQRQLLQITLEAAGAAQPPAVARAASARDDPSASATPLVMTAASEEADSECVICLEAPRECVLIECGHACACEQCAATLAFCPLCRAPIDRVIRMFS